MSNNDSYQLAKNQDYNLIGTALREFAVASVNGTDGTWQLVTAGLSHRNSVLIHNSGVITCYVGHNGATEPDGMPIPTGEKLAIDVTEDIALYVYASGTYSTSVMELN